MKTDNRGGGAVNEPDDNLEERLAGHFAAELNRAGQDYPALRDNLEPAQAAPSASPGGRGRWPRIALLFTSAAVLAVTVLVASGLLSGSTTGPATQVSGPAAPGVVMGADGIPSQIDGQRVYRVAEKAEWQNLSGSFLLAGYAVSPVGSCPISALPTLPSEADLVDCGSVELLPYPITISPGLGSGNLMLAPLGSSWLAGWEGGSAAVVIRVHAHDPEAALCSAAEKSACAAALVVEAVVWPVVPTEIAGERVYRAADQASFPTSGSFLLGGPFTKPSFVPPCPAISQSAAEQQLIPYCYLRTVDGLYVAPMSNIDELNDEIVVARVHIDDPLAAQCPAAVLAQCRTSVVVETVVWPIAGPIAAPTPTPGVPSSPNPAATDQLGPDGVPPTLNSEPVYRAANLPTALTFLLGGKLTQDTSCAPPTAPLPKPPACGFWMLDGVKVGTMVDLPESLLGQTIIARVERGRSLSICLTGSCFATNLVVDAVVWPAGETVAPPPPPSPTPMAS
jgi:hypothetical protein